MPKYVDGYVVPVPRKSLGIYRRMAMQSAKVWRDHGALEVRECVAEDLTATFATPFPKRLKLKKGETVVFSWITFKSRVQRDRINARVMKDPRTAAMMKGPVPFDCKRMLYGGFVVVVNA